MKRNLLSLFAFLVVVTGTAQTISEAFYVYRNDGEFNAFLREEVDSIGYSNYDADSLYYDEIVSQVVYTADSTYWIPLASIDSVSFVTPETKYTPQVVKLDPLLPYIVNVDGMKLTFSSDIPMNLFPKSEDILVLENLDNDLFPTGFAGRLSSRDGLQITCDSVSIGDIYEQIVCYGYYTAVNDSNTTDNSRVRLAAKRRVEGNVSSSISIGRTLGSRENGIYATVDGKLSLDLRFTFKYRKGEPVYFDISSTPELSFNVEAGVNRTYSYSEELELPLLRIPIPDTPFYFKILGGPAFEASVSASVVAKTNAKLGYKFGVKYANEEFKWDGGNTSKWISKPDVDGTINGKLFLGLKIKPGIYLYGDIISGAIKLKAGVELDASISKNLKSSDIFTYDETNDDYVDINVIGSATFEEELKLFKWFKLSAEQEIFSGKFNIYKFKLVPSFTEPNVYYNYSSENSYVVASVIPDDNLIFPVSVGIGLWEDSNSLCASHFCESTYSNRESWPIDEYSTTFQHLSLNKDYTVRPLIKLFGGMIVVPKEVNFKGPEAIPVTLYTTDITESTAIAYGGIKGHELLDETAVFGLAQVEKGIADTIWYDATSIDADGFYNVEFKNLKNNTEYSYFAYLKYRGMMYVGTTESFITEGIRLPYYVWDNANKTATFYYDDKCESRGGYSGLHLYYGLDFSVLKIIFDPSFSDYYPDIFYFSRYSNLQSIEQIEYLNTDSITNMSNMFRECSNLTNLDLSHYNTSNVTDMSMMFWGCSSLMSLDLRMFNTSNVRDMSNMFKSCSSMEFINLSSFNTSNVMSMSCMFEDCSSLTSLDLSNFKLNFDSGGISGLFRNCGSLETIYAGNWNYDSYLSPAPFSGCQNLRGGMGTKIGQNLYGYDDNGNPLYYNVESYRSIYARPDGGKDNPGLFTIK